MNKTLLYLSLALVTFIYADDFAHQKEVVTVYGTTLEITQECKLYITYKNKKREKIPFVLNHLKHCSIMRGGKFGTAHVAYVAAYGDYIFAVQAPVWDKEDKKYDTNIAKLMITKPEGKVYFSELNKGGGLNMEEWQYRVESGIIRDKYKLHTERLDVEHRDFINRDK